MKKQIPKVVLLIENSRQFGRDLQRGIAKYASLHGPWNFYSLPPFFIDMPSKSRKVELSRLKKWGANGAIVRDITKLDEIEALGIPMIISSNIEAKYHGYPNILTDDYRVGKLAAEHLLERGFKKFAFVDYYDFYWSGSRFRGFREEVENAGYDADYYRQPDSKSNRIWDIEQQIMGHWLKNLSKPVGLMACVDERAHDVIEACKQQDILTPEEVAIVSGDNDELICELSNPQISSVGVDGKQAGYEAARLLDQLMQGQKPENTTIPVHATHVAARQSTDILAINDPTVAEALQFMKLNLARPIQVQDIARQAAMTRQGLNKKFKNVLGRSIHEELAILRIQHIKRLLQETNLSIFDIAQAAGQMEPYQLSRFFRKQTGISPLRYRKQFQMP